MAKSDKPLVLVADDEPSTLALVASHLRGRGYRVIEASDGDDAWDKACRELPDLVVLDVMMPGMSGWEVCRKIREAVSLAHTGIIMLTGIGETLNELTSPLYGADAYLDKPFQFNQLAELVKSTLDKRKGGALGRPANVDESPEAGRRKANGRPAARLWKSAQDEEKRRTSAAVGKGSAKAPAKKAPAKKAPAKKAPAKKAPGKKAPAKKAPAKKAPAKKAPGKKAPGKKAPAKKAPAKKAPAKAPSSGARPSAKRTVKKSGRKSVA